MSYETYLKNQKVSEQVSEIDKEINDLEKRLDELKAQSDAAEQKLQTLCSQHEIKELGDIDTMAEKAGVSREEFLEAIKEGTIMSLIERNKDK